MKVYELIEKLLSVGDQNKEVVAECDCMVVEDICEEEDMVRIIS